MPEEIIRIKDNWHCILCGKPYDDYYLEKHGRDWDKHHIRPGKSNETVNLCMNCHHKVHTLMRQGLNWEEIYV